MGIYTHRKPEMLQKRNMLHRNIEVLQKCNGRGPLKSPKTVRFLDRCGSKTHASANQMLR